ncbi:hypothetical protein HBZS_113080 [Helicobacter bizzozeronii CCUG 35545]|nr:hypothetical protein HBZS_113080 [Helicobacter bizzozeronii CCUG 35545]
MHSHSPFCPISVARYARKSVFKDYSKAMQYCQKPTTGG